MLGPQPFDKDVVKLLFEHRADVDAKENDGLSSLHFACKNCCLEKFKFLIENGANVHVNGEHLLHQACEHGNLEVSKLLVENGGSDVNVSDDCGNTPLHQACLKGHLEVSKFLLSRGASVNVETLQGEMPLQVACRANQCDMVWFLVRQHPWLLEELLE